MFKKCFILFLAFISCFYLAAYYYGKKSVIDSMIKYEAYEGIYEGDSDEISPQWKNYEGLKKKFTEDEIAELCEHTNPIVRCYAFKALTEKCSPKAYPILLKHLSDTAYFFRFYGCSGGSNRVTDNFLEQVGYYKREPTKFTLTEEQFNYIDSILLFGNEIEQLAGLGFYDYPSRAYLLKRLKPLPHFYNRIKELVNAGVYEALLVFAKYKEAADTAVFISLLRNDEFSDVGRNRTIEVRRAIQHFPHNSFYPVLKELLMKEVGTNGISDEFESYPLYVALMQYPTQDTRKALETALEMSEEERETRSRYIFFALKETPSKVFEGLSDYVPRDWEK